MGLHSDNRYTVMFLTCNFIKIYQNSSHVPTFISDICCLLSQSTQNNTTVCSHSFINPRHVSAIGHPQVDIIQSHKGVKCVELEASISTHILLYDWVLHLPDDGRRPKHVEE